MAGTIKTMGRPSGISSPPLNLLIRFEGSDFFLRGLIAKANQDSKSTTRTFLFNNFKFSGWRHEGPIAKPIEEMTDCQVDQTFDRIDVRGWILLCPVFAFEMIAAQYPRVRMTLKHIGPMDSGGRVFQHRVMENEQYVLNDAERHRFIDRRPHSNDFLEI